MTGNRKLYLNGGFFVVLFTVSTVALWLGKATFPEWASFNQWIGIGIGAVFTAGNIGEHVSGALTKPS